MKRQNKKTTVIRLLIFYLFFINVSAVSYAQRKVIDLNAINSWSCVSTEAIIAGNGKFVAYSINYGTNNFGLIVKAVNGSWQKEFQGCNVLDAEITEDNKYILFNHGRDSLAVLSLGGENVFYFGSVSQWKLVEGKTKTTLAYLSFDKSKKKSLNLINIESRISSTFHGVKNFIKNDLGTSLLLELEDNNTLCWLDINSRRISTIITGKKISNTKFDDSGNNVAFIARDEGVTSELWIYNSKLGKSINLTNMIPTYNDGVTLNTIDGFSTSGKSLYLKLQNPNRVTPLKTHSGVDVTIWNTMDLSDPVFNYTSELSSAKENRTYLAILLIDSKRFMRLENGDTTSRRLSFNDKDWFIRRLNAVKSVTGTWNELVSGNSGAVRSLDNISTKIGTYATAPSSGKYIVYYDPLLKGHCSYDVDKKITRQITQGVNNVWVQPADHDTDASSVPNYLGWLREKEKIVVTDGYDLWLLDASGLDKPKCLTLGIGRKRNLIFSISSVDGRIDNRLDNTLINIFDKNTKSSGFLLVETGKVIDERLINLQPFYYYSFPGMEHRAHGNDFRPVKAKKSPIYLVKRMKSSQSPNFFTTTDFVKFEPQSSVFPEKEYNFPSSTLINWNNSLGKKVQGILYRPADFNENKKYPVIINYYEKDADGLHGFYKPSLMIDNINIPWFVSRGYLVLLADIHYMTGRPGESAFDCINSGANMLESLSFVDRSKIGIMGHSFGGYETNFIVTKTHRFAAALSAAGISDLVSFYGDYSPAFRSPLQNDVESFQFRMSGSLWEKKRNYLENSPILNVDNITTPLLLIHNFKDGAVPFRESAAFLMALRKNKKQAWLLQYDNSDHLILNKSESLDYTIRATQFFDYYLKNEPMPSWMKSVDQPKNKRFIN